MDEMKKLVGVAACPAGIAHTYIAAEYLIKAAKAQGYDLKMETNGAGGVENRLTDEEIAEAEVIVLAIDTMVEMERFRGKPVLTVSSSDAIHRGAQVIQQVIDGKAKVYNP
jgi:fructose-specific phosphotransferase system IIB component